MADDFLNLPKSDHADVSDDVNLDAFLEDLKKEFPEDINIDLDFGEEDILKSPEKPERPVPPKPRFQASAEKPDIPKHHEPEKDAQNPAEAHLPGKEKSKVRVFLLLAALLLAIGIAAVIVIMGNADPYGGKILENVHVAGIDVGGMTQKEALSAISSGIGSDYYDRDITVVIGKYELLLSSEKLHPELDLSGAVSTAYAYGRTGNAVQRHSEYLRSEGDSVDVALTQNLSLDTDYIRSMVSSVLDDIVGEYVPSGYCLEGDQPALDAVNFDESAACQTLVLTIGHPGSGYDMDGIVSQIAEAWGDCASSVEISQKYLPEMPEDLNLQEIYDALHIDAVEAADGKDGSCGYTFSLSDASETLSSAAYGDVLAVPMEYIMPQELECNGSFTVTLSSYATPISSDEAYNENMHLLCDALDGLTLSDGEQFSFDVLFKNLTSEDGYQIAPAHGDQCLETELAGGQDQVATTLYAAAMSGGMTLVERNSAQHACAYAERGTELTVSGSRDLKFKNASGRTVLIRAKVTNTQVVIRFLSEQEADYEIKLETEQLSTTAPGTVSVRKKAADGYSDQQVLFEGIPGGQIRLNWITFRKGTDTQISTYSEYVTVPALSKAVVSLG